MTSQLVDKECINEAIEYEPAESSVDDAIDCGNGSFVKLSMKGEALFGADALVYSMRQYLKQSLTYTGVLETQPLTAPFHSRLVGQRRHSKRNSKLISQRLSWISLEACSASNKNLLNAFSLSCKLNKHMKITGTPLGFLSAKEAMGTELSTPPFLPWLHAK